MTTDGWKGNQFVLVFILILQGQVTLEDGHSGEQHGAPAPHSMSQTRFQTNFGQSREEGSESQSEESDEGSEENEEDSDEVGIKYKMKYTDGLPSFVLTRMRMAITVSRNRNMKPLTKRRK